jgi:hypothetical protein
MQTFITINCKWGTPSLRQTIKKDKEGLKANLLLITPKRRLKKHDLLKVVDKGVHGTIQLRWDDEKDALKATVTTDNDYSPAIIIGRFVKYLLEFHTDTITSIFIEQKPIK